MATTVYNWLKLGKTAGSKLLLLGLVATLLAVVVEAADQASNLTLRPNAPASYTVKEGDTLWDISGRFLVQPWMWPQVWQVNPQIKNPDLIYPGDVITLSYQDGKPVLSVSRTESDASASANNSAASAAAPSSSSSASAAIATNTTPQETGGIRTVKLSPEVRREPMSSPIPAIPLSKVFAFLSKSSVADLDTFQQAPYLLGEQQGRTTFSSGNVVFARGKWNDNVTTYDIVREGRRFTDPDTKKQIGVESIMIGTASISTFNGERAVMKIDSTTQEARVGDRLVPRQKLAIDDSYMPVPPTFDVDAAIASIASGNSLAGQYDTLVLNQGSKDGLKAGHVLAVQKPGTVVDDEVGKFGLWQRIRHGFGMSSGRTVEYPGEKIANVLIYRTYDHASLALVLNASQEITLNYRVVTP